MTSPEMDEDAIARELDEYLCALERGSHEIGPAASDEVGELREIVGDLHRLADLLGFDPSSDAKGLPTGDVFGKYVVRRRLGQGGQSTTFLAFDPELQREVVLKRYHSPQGLQALERVLNEARGLARLSSPYLSQCYAVEVLEGHPVLVMEYIPGVTLDVYLNRRRPSSDDISSLIQQLAVALKEVHRFGLVHRDLKPKNIILGDDGRPRLVDFGLVLSQPGISRSVSGTPAYMAPEQARGENERIDARTDLFALGGVLYEMLTGVAPFAASTREAALARAKTGQVDFTVDRFCEAPRWLRVLCRRALAPDPKDRVESAEQFIQLVTRGRGRSLQFRMAAIIAASLVFIVSGLLLLGSDYTPTKWAPAVPSTFDSMSQIATVHVPDSVFESFTMGRQLRRDFHLEVEIVGARRNDGGLLQLVDGDQLLLRITSERSCFITVLNYSEEPPTQLFPLPPYDSLEDSFAIAHHATTFPRLADHRNSAVFRAKPSKGKEALCIIASTKPIALVPGDGPEPLLEFRTSDQQAKLRSWLRGVVREPQTTTRALSQIIVPYQVEAADFSHLRDVMKE